MVTREEDYVYDPDGQRLYRSHNGLNTIYLDDGLVELDYPGNANYPSRTYYPFNGQIVAQASKTAPTSPRTLIWLHGDQLGSTSLLTDGGGLQSGPTQEFDPWGAVRSGRLSTTALNYTGQKLDGALADSSGTGLLYYGARYYNPALGRFVSADAIVQESPDLMVDLRLKGDTFQRGGKTGPLNPQYLDRYSYVLNNPVRNTDPSGHIPAEPLAGSAGVQGSKGNYRDMLQLTYEEMMYITSGADKDFDAIKSQIHHYKQNVGSPISIFESKVCGGCAWDMKQVFRKAYGLPSGKNLFFDLGSTKDVAFSVFGNILYGYVGKAAGLNNSELIGGAAAADYVGDPKGVNWPDLEAVNIGIALWNKYGPGLTEAELDSAIKALVESGLVHTKTSIEQGKWCGAGLRGGCRDPNN